MLSRHYFNVPILWPVLYMYKHNVHTVNNMSSDDMMKQASALFMSLIAVPWQDKFHVHAEWLVVRHHLTGEEIWLLFQLHQKNVNLTIWYRTCKIFPGCT